MITHQTLLYSLTLVSLLIAFLKPDWFFSLFRLKTPRFMQSNSLIAATAVLTSQSTLMQISRKSANFDDFLSPGVILRQEIFRSCVFVL